MQIEQYVVGPIATNCYFVIAPDTKELIVIDPGASGRRLADMAQEKGYQPVAILLTHGHFDHADGVEDFIASFPDATIPVYAHEAERRTLEDPSVNLSGEMSRVPKRYRVDEFVRDGQRLTLAGFSIRVIHTPGHTEGGCCYYFPEEAALFPGDSLFAGSIGRTDFPGGSLGTLVRSVKEKLLTLPEETKVYPGHEGLTTIGDERVYNPFLS